MNAIAFAEDAADDAPVQVTVESPRRAFYRDEVAAFRVRVHNISSTPLADARVEATLPGVASEAAPIGTLASGGDATALLRFPAGLARAGAYELKIVVRSGEDEAGSVDLACTIAERPNPDRMPVWLWPHQAFLNQTYTFDEEARHAIDWWRDVGVNVFSIGERTDGGGPVTPDMRRTWDYLLTQRAHASLLLHGGLRGVEALESIDEDTRFKVSPDKVLVERGMTMANPFHPEVAAWQNAANRRIMEAARDYPQIATAFVNTEVLDYVRINRNPRGLAVMQDRLGFTELTQTEPSFVAPGVLADDDQRYNLWKYEFKWGNGVALSNRRAAAMVDRYRPDILVINDPYRSYPLLDGFPGVDVIGSWTYTSPDPKLMLYVETLRAACRNTDKTPLHTLTMLTSPGHLAPNNAWMMIGPDRLAETMWINLSRAPRMLCYYVSSMFDPTDPPEGVDDFRMPPATFEKMRQLSRQVIEPFGPLLRQAQVTPRRVAVLSSGASEVNNGIRRALDDGAGPLLGHYPNMQVYHVYTLLAMAHIPADVVFDETVQRIGLDGYDMLVIPRGSALPESVYQEVLAFQKRGGVVVADEHLAAPIPGVIRLDFDFRYRSKVTAKAIAAATKLFEGVDSAGAEWQAALEEADAVTALDDRRIMERYARQLRERLDDHVSRTVDCDSPHALLNLLEGAGAKYLVVVNDDRRYGERVGEYRAMLEDVAPGAVNVTLTDWQGGELHAYDLLTQAKLDATPTDAGLRLPVELGDIGGTILALYDRPLERIDVAVTRHVPLGATGVIRITAGGAEGEPIAGLQPVRVTITDPNGEANALSGYYCLQRGCLDLPLTVALNDVPGTWTVAVDDLTAGLNASATFEVPGR